MSRLLKTIFICSLSEKSFSLTLFISERLVFCELFVSGWDCLIFFAILFLIAAITSLSFFYMSLRYFSLSFWASFSALLFEMTSFVFMLFELLTCESFFKSFWLVIESVFLSLVFSPILLLSVFLLPILLLLMFFISIFLLLEIASFFWIIFFWLALPAKAAPDESRWTPPFRWWMPAACCAPFVLGKA